MPHIFLEGLWRITIKFFQDRRCPVPDWNWEPPEHKCRVLVRHQPALFTWCHNKHQAAYRNTTQSYRNHSSTKWGHHTHFPTDVCYHESLESRCIVIQGVQLPWQPERLTDQSCHVQYCISHDKTKFIACSPIHTDWMLFVVSEWTLKLRQS
jgi:hypothetical protein